MEKSRKADKEYRERQQKVKVIEQEVARLGKVKVQTVKDLNLLDKQVKEKNKLLDHAKALDGLGFGPDDLRKLKDIMEQVAAEGGVQGRKAISLFFEGVECYGGLMSLEMETKGAQVRAEKAKAEAERWNSEAKTAESKAKARKVSIDFADKLLTLGVKETDLPRWNLILLKAGISPENLASELEKLVTWKKLLQERRKRSDELQREVVQQESRLKALKQDEVETHAAIQAIRETSLAELQQTKQESLSLIEGMVQQVMTHLKSLGGQIQEFGDLREQLGNLRGETALAGALRSNDPKIWGTLGQDDILQLFSAVLIWAQVKRFNPRLVLPEAIKQALGVIYISSYSRVNFADLIKWAATALVMEDQRALATPSKEQLAQA